MLIHLNDLQNIPIRTQSGKMLGKIDNLIIDADSQSLFQYLVKAKGIKNIFVPELLINRDQIISISKEEIIVEDSILAVKPEQENTKEKEAFSTTSAVSD